MRFFHIADVHLGMQPDKGCAWSEDRGREIWESFKRIIQQAGRENAGLFLIAGDLFHRQPLTRELKEVNALFASVPHVNFVLIAGNHDYIKRERPSQRISWADNVFWLEGDEISYVDFPALGTRVWGLSYHSREIREPLYDQIKAERKTGDKLPFQVLLAHGGDEKHIPIKKDTFYQSGFDYIALGHIHKPQISQNDHIAYSGSLEPLDKNEIGMHGYIKGEYTEEGIRIGFVPFACREYKKLKLQVTEKTTQVSLEKGLEKILEERGRQHIYTILLEGTRGSHTEFYTDSLMKLGNILEVRDDTHRAYSFNQLLKQYDGSVLAEYIRSFPLESLSKEDENILRLGVEALLESGEELL